MKGKNAQNEAEYQHVVKRLGVPTIGPGYALGIFDDRWSSHFADNSVYSNKNAEKPSRHLSLNGQETAKLVAGNAKSQLSAI